MRYAALIIAVLLSSCYSERKARSQFGKAAAAYPLVAAEYCGITFPPKDSLIKGDSVVTFDTLFVGGSVRFDTVTLRGLSDTIRITKIVQLPGAVITQRIFIHDTLQVVNTAALKACEIALHQSVVNEGIERTSAAKWQKIAKKRFWILFGIGLVGVAFIANKVYRTITKPKI